MPDSTRPTCGSPRCPWWDKGSEECRKYAPGKSVAVSVFENAREYENSHAHMKANKWCGEHPDFQDWIDHDFQKRKGTTKVNG